MAKDSSGYIYAAVSNSIYISSDNGNNWQSNPSGSFPESIQAIVSTPTCVLIAAYNQVYRSTNHGQNWILSGNGLSSSIIKCFHVKDNFIYAGEEVVFKSSNDGINWTTSNQYLGHVVYSIGSLGNYLFAETSIGSRGRMFVSSNNGDYWDSVKVGSSSSRFYMSHIATSGNYVYVGGMPYNRVFRTDNFGQNWSYVPGLPSPGNGVVLSVTARGNVIAISYTNSTGNRIYLSTDFGLTFNPTGEGYFQKVINSCLITNNGLFAHSDDGIFKSTNYGLNWYGANSGFSNVNFTNVVSFDSLVIAGSDGNGVYLSRNYGSTWSLISSLGTTCSSLSYLYESNRIYLYNSSGLVYSANNGINWITIPKPPVVETQDHFYVKGSLIFFVTDAGIYKTSNFGLNWIKSDNGISFPYIMDGAIFVNDDVALVQIIDMNLNYALYKSTNQGGSWILKTPPGTNQNEIKFFVQYFNTIYAGSFEGLFASTNNGDSWILKNNGMPLFFVEGLTMLNNDLYVATESNGIFKSTNNASTWQPFNEGLTNNSVYSISSGSNVLYAGGLASFYKRDLQTSIIKREANLPSNYSLSQNYPNPFNPSTKIEFKVPSSEGYGVSRGVGLVTLQVFDITGREVQTLVNEQLQPGTYEVTFDGSGLNSGVYFYKLISSGYSQTKRMVLVK